MFIIYCTCVVFLLVLVIFAGTFKSDKSEMPPWEKKDEPRPPWHHTTIKKGY